jgi:6-phosphofructokinase 1
MTVSEDLIVQKLGPCLVRSPLNLSTVTGDFIPDYTSDDARVLVDVEFREGESLSRKAFERAGARPKIFFDPKVTRAAIVTCGGLCPGLNNVVRSMVLELHHKYGVRDVIGFRYGFEGLNPAVGVAPVTLDPATVEDIHKHGGSVLGLSRGKQDIGVMVDTLVARGVSLLFCIGGDGTLRAAHAISDECLRRGLAIAVVGVPKTVDNDVAWVDKTFGFDTAVEIARQAIDGAHSEARGARNGVGIVKLMGRDAGFITASATLASEDVNFCLVPELPFDLEGPKGLLAVVERRLAARGHAVIAVAEGCAAHFADDGARDASGNARYASGGNDVGPMLRDAIAGYFKRRGVPSTVKYIDPSYMIRSGPANASDAIFCNELARNAVHAGMAGRTGVLVGRWHRRFTHVPLAHVTGQHKRIDPDGALWLSVLESTGQPRLRNTPSMTVPSLLPPTVP